MRSKRLFIPVYGLAIILTIGVLDYWLYRGITFYSTARAITFLILIWGILFVVTKKFGQKTNDAA